MSKLPTTKLSHTMRKLAEEIRAAGDEIRAKQLETSANQLDQAAHIMGARGERVKTLGAYYAAASLYRHVTGKPYEG